MQMVALLVVQVHDSFLSARSSPKLLLCGGVPGIQKLPLWGGSQGNKHSDIRKDRVAGKHGKSKHLNQACRLQDDSSYTIDTVVPGVSWQNSALSSPGTGYVDFSFPDQTMEPDSLCTLTCFHIVGIGWVPQPFQSCEEKKSAS